MLNIHLENIVSLSDATKYIPPLNGKKVHAASIWRWCRRGVNGVHLEYGRVGRRMVTTREALDRFINALAKADEAVLKADVQRKLSSTTSTPAQRARQIADAEKVLDDHGIH